MKNEPFLQLFIEFGPSEFQGAILWVPEVPQTMTVSESEVVAIS